MVSNPTLAILCLDTLCDLFELGCRCFELDSDKIKKETGFDTRFFLFEIHIQGENSILHRSTNILNLSW